MYHRPRPAHHAMLQGLQVLLFQAESRGAGRCCYGDARFSEDATSLRAAIPTRSQVS